MLLVAGMVSPLWAQNVMPPVGAGTLLEQQRRLNPAQAPQAVEPGGVTSEAVPAPDAQRPQVSGIGAQTTVLRFQIDGSTLVEPEAVQAALARWVGRPVSLGDLREATTALETLYRDRGWLARVNLPGQDITDGTVRFSVTESHLGRILLKAGDQPLRSALTARVQILLAQNLPAGQPLNLRALERAMLLADDIPGVRVVGTLQASDTSGSTDLVVVLSPSEAYRGEANADNGGNRATGSERATVQLRLLSPFGEGEQFNLGGSVSRGSQYVSVGASAPLPGSLGNQGWRVVGTASALRYKVRDARNTTTGLPPEGGSSTFGLGVQYPLFRTPVANWLFSAAYGQTRLLNRDDNQTLGSLDTTSRARSNALVLSLAGSQFDRWQGGGVTSASIALSRGQLRLGGSPASYIAGDAQTADTQGNFTKLRWNASRLQTITPSLSLLIAGTGQFASANLDPSEKMYLGGIDGVRAYPNAEGGGSTGAQVSFDLRQDLGTDWQISGFYDWGRVQQFRRNRYPGTANALIDSNRITLRGYGLGLTWRGAKGIQVKGTWARRIGSNPIETTRGTDTDGSLHKDRFWLSASIAF